MKCIQRHASDIAMILEGYSRATDWLMVAAGINSIEFSWNQFDPYNAAIWCNSASEYDEAKSEITQAYVYELTLFNYIWGGFENLVSDIFTRQQLKKYGKVNCVTKLIKEKGYFPIIEHQKTIEEFSDLIQYKFEEELMEIPKNNFQNYDQNGIALQLIYKLRNEFAHGDLYFPDVHGYTFINSKKLINLIELSSRIVLFYMQALIILKEAVVYDLHPYRIFFDSSKYADDLYETKLKYDYILSRIHLDSIPYNDTLNTIFNTAYFELNIPLTDEEN